jgi:hypothetical protein
MPHVFGMMLDGSKASDAHFDETVKFCKEAVEGGVGESDAVFLLAKTLERRDVDLKTVTEITDEEVERITREAKERIEKRHGDAVGETKPML